MPDSERLAELHRTASAAIESLYAELRRALRERRAPAECSDYRHIEAAFIGAQSALAEFRVVLDAVAENDGDLK